MEADPVLNYWLLAIGVGGEYAVIVLLALVLGLKTVCTIAIRNHRSNADMWIGYRGLQKRMARKVIDFQPSHLCDKFRLVDDLRAINSVGVLLLSFLVPQWIAFVLLYVIFENFPGSQNIIGYSVLVAVSIVSGVAGMLGVDRVGNHVVPRRRALRYGLFLLDSAEGFSLQRDRSGRQNALLVIHVRQFIDAAVRMGLHDDGFPLREIRILMQDERRQDADMSVVTGHVNYLLGKIYAGTLEMSLSTVPLNPLGAFWPAGSSIAKRVLGRFLIFIGSTAVTALAASATGLVLDVVRR